MCSRLKEPTSEKCCHRKTYQLLQLETVFSVILCDFRFHKLLERENVQHFSVLINGFRRKVLSAQWNKIQSHNPVWDISLPPCSYGINGSYWGAQSKLFAQVQNFHVEFFLLNPTQDKKACFPLHNKHGG